MWGYLQIEAEMYGMNYLQYFHKQLSEGGFILC